MADAPQPVDQAAIRAEERRQLERRLEAALETGDESALLQIEKRLGAIQDSQEARQDEAPAAQPSEPEDTESDPGDAEAPALRAEAVDAETLLRSAGADVASGDVAPTPAQSDAEAMPDEAVDVETLLQSVEAEDETPEEPATEEVPRAPAPEVVTINMVRVSRGLNPIPGGDVRASRADAEAFLALPSEERTPQPQVEVFINDVRVSRGLDPIPGGDVRASREDVAEFLQRPDAETIIEAREERIRLEAEERLAEVERQRQEAGERESRAALRDIEQFQVEGGHDLAAALRAGVNERTLETAGFTQDQIEEARATRRQQDAAAQLEAVTRDGRIDLLEALDRGFSPDTLTDAGFTEEQVAAASERFEQGGEQAQQQRRRQREAVIQLEPVTRDGQVNLLEALDQGFSEETLTSAGFSEEQVAQARRVQEERRRQQQQEEARLNAKARRSLRAFREEKERQEEAERQTRRATTENRRQRREEAARRASEATAELARVQNALDEAQVTRPGFLDRVTDTVQEGITFGQAETESFNRDDIEGRYDQVRAQAARDYDSRVAELAEKGLQVTERKEDWVDRVAGFKSDYVDTVLDAQPTLAETAKEVSLASIPFYGTARTWEDSPGWARALGVASDLLFLVPVVGQASAGVRGGLSVGKIASNIAVSEIKAPLTAVRHPIRTTRAALSPVETLLRPRRVPLAAAEIRERTVRIPAQELGEAAAIQARDVATLEAIRGERAVARVPTGTVELAPVALQRVVPMAVHATPDIRPFLTGVRVEGTEGGLFVAPTLHTRFTRSSAFGEITGPAIREAAQNIENAEEALKTARAAKAPRAQINELEDTLKKARAFQQFQTETRTATRLARQARVAERSGDTTRAARLNKEAGKADKAALKARETVARGNQPGALLITDPEVLPTLQGSGKLYKGTAEIEAVIPDGINLPPPSQILSTSDASGRTLRLAVVGPELSQAQVAQLKFVGAVDTVRDIFRPAVTVDGRPVSAAARAASAAHDEVLELLTRSRQLESQAERARALGNIAEADNLEASARSTISQANRQARDVVSRPGFRGSLRPVAGYVGQQDVATALEALDAPGPRRPIGEDDRTQARGRGAVVSQRMAGAERGPVDGEPSRVHDGDGQAVRLPEGLAFRPIQQPVAGIAERPQSSFPERPTGDLPSRPITLPPRGPGTEPPPREEPLPPGEPPPFEEPPFRQPPPPGEPEPPPREPSRDEPPPRKRPPGPPREPPPGEPPPREPPPPRETGEPPPPREPPPESPPPPEEPSPRPSRVKRERGRILGVGFSGRMGLEAEVERFPEVVAYKAGFGYRIVNIDTGESAFSLERPEGVPDEDGPGASGRSYTILTTDTDPPRQRDLDLGITEVNVSRVGPRFTARRRRKS